MATPRYGVRWATTFLLAAALLTPAARAHAAEPEGDPDGDAVRPDRACLAGLRERHVDFIEAPTRAVRTPIRLVGPLGPLRLVMRGTNGGVQAVMDCQLARALLDAAGMFQLVGIRELTYSGMYQYRNRRGSTKLSEHAHGLAIDVHAFGLTDGTVVDVERDFEKGVGRWAITEQEECVGAPARPAGRLLRQLACGLRASSAFRQIITADDNADHDNHFHIEAFPDALSRTKALLAHREPVIDD